MEISDVRVKLIRDSSDRLKAVCTITFDGEFVVRDVKVVEGTNGMFVAMPSRKLSAHCPRCRHKNHLRSRYCNECGTQLPCSEPSGDGDARERLHSDVAHPITASCRQQVQQRVIEAYQEECECSDQPASTVESGEFGKSDLEDSVPETDPEPKSEDDSVAVTEAKEPDGNEAGDYNAIIAGLKGRSGRGSDAASADRPLSRPRDSRGSSERIGREAPAPRSTAEPSSERASVVPKEKPPQPKSAPVSRSSGSVPNEGRTAFGAGLARESGPRPTEVNEEPSPLSAPTDTGPKLKDPPDEDVRSGAGKFGEGIL